MRLKNLTDASEAFSKFESLTGIYGLTIQDVPVWEIIRFSTFQRLCVKAGIIDIGHPKVNFNLRTYLNYSYNLIKSSLSRKKMINYDSDALVLGHPRLMMNSDGQYEDPYSEAYLKGTNVSYTYLERSFRGHFFSPRFPGRHIYIDDLRLRSSRSKQRITADDKQKLSELEKELRQTTGYIIPLTNQVSLALGRRALLLPFYERLLNDLRPKVGIIVVGYLQPAFIEACRNHNIPVIEIQHGVISKFHYGYHHNVSAPSRYYPDQLWLWGNYWRDAAVFPKKTQLRSIGFPLFETNKKVTNTKIDNACLFVSQGSVGSRIAECVRDLRAAKPNLKIYYRLHPSEFDSWEKKYSDFPENNIKIIFNDDGTIYDWFSKIKYVIGGYSTALFEAVGMGCKVGVIKQSGIEYMDTLIKQNGATIIESNWESYFEEDQSTTFNIDSLFEPYSAGRVCSLFEEYMNK